jgi:hypothetical protein
MATKTELIWVIAPRDFMEEGSLPVRTALGEWSFSNGSAGYTLSVPTDPVPDDAVERIRRDLESLLLARCLLIDRPYSINKHPTIHQHTTTGIDVRNMIEGGKITITGGSVDIVISDHVDVSMRDDVLVREMETDRVLIDTAATRRQSHATWMRTHAPLIADSDALHYMCSSYQRSLEDSSNALVHLGEIKDTLQKELGGEHAAKRTLPNNAWATLGRLANDEPLLEGRHRGKHYEILRPATTVELQSARQAAKDLISAFEKSLVSPP